MVRRLVLVLWLLLLWLLLLVLRTIAVIAAIAIAITLNKRSWSRLASLFPVFRPRKPQPPDKATTNLIAFGGTGTTTTSKQNSACGDNNIAEPVVSKANVGELAMSKKHTISTPRQKSRSSRDAIVS